MCIVDVRYGLILRRHVDDVFEGCDVSVHAEDSVDNASVVELVADDEIPLINKRKDRARVSSITRLKRDRRFSPTIVCENLLQLQMNIHSARDDSYRSRPGTILSRSSNRGLF